MSTAGVGSTTSVNLQSIQSMDIETALMAVQSERVKMLDTQLATQLEEVQNRNNQIAKLNTVLNSLNDYAAEISGTEPGDKPASWPREKELGIEVPLNDAIREAGITDLGFELRNGQLSTLDAEGNPVGEGITTVAASKAIVSGSTTKKEIEKAITNVKSMIDAQSNSQQTDMLRLQSMSNKRNEAFDVMTNFVKKMQESRSSIIGNMR